MSEWWSYRLSDFLMFSPATYWRLVALYHQEIWPAQLLAAAGGVGCVALARRPGPWPARLVCALLAAAWLWVGWAFHAQRYATINWAASWFGLAFALQGLLLGLAALAVRPRAAAVDVPAPPQASPGRAGWLLAAAAVGFYPLAGLPAGRTLAQAEMFAVTPDPTALATLGLLLALRAQLPRGWCWLLIPIPLLSLAIGAATLWTLRGV